MLSEGPIVCLCSGFLQGNVLESMTTSPLTANPEMLISEAAAIMLTHSVRREHAGDFVQTYVGWKNVTLVANP